MQFFFNTPEISEIFDDYVKYWFYRMANLLGLSKTAAEESLNTMVVGKTVQAKIDRLDGIVDFQTTTDPNQV